MMKRLSLIFLLSLLLTLAAAMTPRAAQESRTSVRSRHFFLVGDAAEKDLRRYAAKLEQFRAVFAQLFPQARLNSPLPTTVLVFKDKTSFQPFTPLYQGKPRAVAGYFLATNDAQYIALTTEPRFGAPFGTILHEYAHALLNDNTRHTPVWLNEGLAEFYSACELTGEQQITLGRPLPQHRQLLRGAALWPLARLFAVTHESPDYNEHDQRSMFYAQSWALVHYLLLGDNGARQQQLLRYLALLKAEHNSPPDFPLAPALLEKELHDYLNRPQLPQQTFVAAQRVQFDAATTSAPLSEAEWQYYLGELLRQQQRPEAEEYLQKAVALNPDLGVAQAALGLLRTSQQRFVAARQHFERAVTASPQNYLVHYYYASALIRVRAAETEAASEPPAELTRALRTHAWRAYALAPDFPEAAHLLAQVSVWTGEELSDAITRLKHALAQSPNREDYSFTLAQLYLRQHNYEAAQPLLKLLARIARQPRLRERAQTQLGILKQLAEQVARLQAAGEAFPLLAKPRTAEAPPAKPPRQFEGDEVRGLLTRIDCTDASITLTVKVGGRTWQFFSATPARVFFITYTREVSRTITCGALTPAPRVLVTYRAAAEAQAKYAGEPVAVEFIKTEER